MQEDVDYILSKIELYEVHPAEDDDEEQLLSKVRKYPISKS